MNSDFGKATDKILKIMENISGIKGKLERERKKNDPNELRIDVWEKELKKSERALERRRVMA